MRLPEYEKTGTLVHPINWNVLQDPKDRETLDVLESNFWLPEEIAVSNDIKSWNSLTEKEKLLTARVFAGLTLLDTVQSQFGAEVLKNDSETQHESAVFSQIQYMECLTAEHELLTDYGWKSIKDVSYSDKVAQYSENGTISFVTPLNISSHFAKKTYLLTTNSGKTKQHVSEGHRLVYNKLVTENGNKKWKLTECIASEFNLKDVQDNSHLISSGVSELKTDWRISDFLSDEHKSLIIDIIVNDSKTLLSDIFEIQNMSYEEAIEFMETVLLAFDNKYRKESHSCVMEVEENVDFIQAVGVISGIPLTKEFIGSSDGKYRLSLDGSYVRYSLDNATFEEKPGEMVYGVEVPSTYLITRNGGTVTVTGNCVHARSYSNIFSTLMSTEEINDIMEWAWSDEYLRNKQEIILKHYQGDDPYMRKIASVFLESFLFYSGFFWAFYLSSRQKMTNTSTMISLILRDERLSKDHELLTPSGWKSVSDITYDDVVAQYDKDSGKISSFVYPITMSTTNDTHTYLFESSDGKTKQHVSTNHRMLIAHIGEDGSITKEVVPASEITVNSDGYIDGMLIKQTFDEVSCKWIESYVPGVRRLNAGSSEMYAVSVPSTFLLTRLDGSVTVTGNCIHGYYIGYKFQRMMERLSDKERESYREKAMNLFKELYANELKYTESIYDEVLDTRPGITDEVKKFLRYNGNKALLNLGFEPMFSAKETEVLPSIMTSLTPNSNENHDFFSDKGSSYKRSTVEETSDDDWD